MKCEKCGVNPATVHTMIMVNGKKTEQLLCSQCWAAQNSDTSASDPFTFTDLFKGLLQPQMSTAQASSPQPKLVCPTCSMDFRTFQESGLLGCADCYQVFLPMLEPTLTKIHGKARHEGKTPRRCGSTISIARQIESLRVELTKAVAAEDYESAAILRDKIKALSDEKQQNKGKEEA